MDTNSLIPENENASFDEDGASSRHSRLAAWLFTTSGGFVVYLVVFLTIGACSWLSAHGYFNVGTLGFAGHIAERLLFVLGAVMIAAPVIRVWRPYGSVEKQRTVKKAAVVLSIVALIAVMWRPAQDIPYVAHPVRHTYDLCSAWEKKDLRHARRHLLTCDGGTPRAINETFDVTPAVFSHVRGTMLRTGMQPPVRIAYLPHTRQVISVTVRSYGGTR